MSNLLDKASIVTTSTAYDNGKILSVKPNTSVGDFDFTRNSSATRVNSQGLIEDMQILSGDLVSNGDFSQESSELVTNGDFATDSDWIKASGWSIANGKAISDGTSGNLRQSNIIVTGKQYKIQATVSDYVSGNVEVSAGAVPRGTMSANGTYTFYQTASSLSSFYIVSNSFIGSIDNVSVKEVGQDWALGTGWSIGEDKAINDGTINQSLLQTNVFTIGKSYKINFTISDVVGSLDARIWMATGGARIEANANGDYTTYWEADGPSLYTTTLSTNTATYSISNISVKEISSDTNLPRIDYTGGEGHWLFEGQSTNLITYSEDFANAAWSKTGNTVVTSNTVISPNGTLNGSTVSGLSGTGSNDLRFVKSGSTANNTYTYSVYLKGSGTVRIQLSNGIDQGFDDTITLTSSWKRHFLTSTFNSTTTPSLTANLDDLNGQTATQFDIYGAQLEQQSFATSLIPTSGSGVTRLADAAFGAGSSDLINSTEGVLYAEIAALANDLTRRIITITDGTLNSIVKLEYKNTSNQIEAVLYNGNTECLILHTLSDETEFNKIAFKYKQDDFSLFVNGIKVGTDTSGAVFTPNTLNNLSFYQGNSNNLYGKVKCVAVFKEALNNDELECLTGEGYESFNALALANNYTII